MIKESSKWNVNQNHVIRKLTFQNKTKQKSIAYSKNKIKWKETEKLNANVERQSISNSCKIRLSSIKLNGNLKPIIIYLICRRTPLWIHTVYTLPILIVYFLWKFIKCTICQWMLQLNEMSGERKLRKWMSMQKVCLLRVCTVDLFDGIRKISVELEHKRMPWKYNLSID